MTAVLDHLAIGTPALTDGWELFGGLLGGRWAYGGDSPGFWWGQLEFAAGPKIELLTPTGGPDAAFLERFLAARGAGPHHFNFLVTDIQATLARIRTLGIEPVGVNLANPNWKEAFLHPRSAHGIVIQVAQQTGYPPADAPPAEFPEPGLPASLEEIEHRVGDLAGATRLFTEALGGRLEAAGQRCRGADLAWRQADQAGARGWPAPRRFAAPRPLHPRRRRVQRIGPGARGPAGQAPRPDGGAGLAQRRRTGIEPASAAVQRSPVLKTGGATRHPNASASTLLRYRVGKSEPERPARDRDRDGPRSRWVRRRRRCSATGLRPASSTGQLDDARRHGETWPDAPGTSKYLRRNAPNRES